MKYENVFYVPHFNIIGGIETYCYELAKKYKYYDIAFVYSNPTSDIKQLNRIRKYCKVIKQPYNAKEKIKCNKLFIMYRCNLDLFEAKEIIQIIHADYKAQNLKPNIDKEVSQYYGVSKAVAKTYSELSGKEVGVCYNPLTIDKPKKILKLISATRLTKEKGLNRMKKLAKELDKKEIPYIWLIFTNKTDEIQSPNVIYMNPRLDIRDYINEADYLVQLSDTEAWAYSVLESIMLKTPVIVTPIPCFEEMGIKNGINGYILPFDMKDIPIDDIYNKIPKDFNIKEPIDIYEELLSKKKNKYDPTKQVYIKAIKRYYDTEEKEYKNKDSKEWKVSITRAEELIYNPKGKLVEIIKGDD